MTARTITNSRLVDGAKLDNITVTAPINLDDVATSAGLALKEDKSNKGIANGYAPLDATGKVPAANLPAGGSWDVTQASNSGSSGRLKVSAGADKSIQDYATAGIVKSDANGVASAAVAGTDYLAPNGNGSALTGIAASQVSNTPAGNIASTTVQWAIDELDAEKVAKVSSTDNAVTRFDGTGGAVQNSGVTLDDTANFAGINEIHFVLSPTPSAYAEGTLRWNNTDHCLDIETGENSTLQVGQEMFVRVRNSTGTTITNGSLCYINGATGNRPTVALAKADAEATAHTLIGMATDDIANNSDGFITIIGTVHDLDTSAYADGAELFLSATTAGAFTNVAPSSPNFVVKIGVVSRSNVSVGQILVQTQVRTVSASNIRWTVEVANGGTGLSAIGTASQQIRVNAWGTALEYFTPTAGGWPSPILTYSTSGVAVAGKVASVRLSQACTFSKLAISLGVLPVGGNFEVNVKKNGTTILSGNLTITTTETASNSYYTVVTGDAWKATITTTTAVAEDVITCEIVAGSGNTFLGADVSILLTGTLS